MGRAALVVIAAAVPFFGCGQNSGTGSGAVDPKYTSSRPFAFVQSPDGIRKFVTSVPGLGPAGANEIGQFLPLATKKTRIFDSIATDVYELAVRPFTERMHPDLPGTTRFWGYTDAHGCRGGNGRGDDHHGGDDHDGDGDHGNGGQGCQGRGDGQQYLGGVIVAKRGTPVLLKLRNELPDRELVPVDRTISAGDGLTVGDLPFNRITTHVHGGKTPWFSDGTPFQWFTPDGLHGDSFMNVPGTDPPPGSATYYYPNDQSARFVWYHDHAMGITRTNAYAGIASALLITDDFEQSLITQGLLPGLGTPLVIQDKSFVPQHIRKKDPTWRWGGPADLFYPHVYEVPPIPDFSTTPFTPGTGRWDHGPVADPPMQSPAQPLPDPSVVPEAFLDTTLVNGGVYPMLAVTDHRVRLRVLNASQARFWHLNLYAEDPKTPGEADTGAPGPTLYQIGTEGGFLPQVVPLQNDHPMPFIQGQDYPVSNGDPTGPFNLLLAPAERADLLVDFSGLAGRTFILYSDAPAPFPSGDARNDYFTGDLDLTAFGGAPSTVAGFGPNTRTVLRIVVGAGPQDAQGTAEVIAALDRQFAGAFQNGAQDPLLYHGATTNIPGPVPFTGQVARKLTLNEDFDARGRLIQRLGTTDNTNLTTEDGLTINGVDNQGLPTWGRSYEDAATENPQAGATEVWEIYNLTGDTHPIHFHLVNVQVIQRAQFDPGTPGTSPPVFVPIHDTERRPDPNEIGWKETVRTNPGEVTTVIARFALPTLPAQMGDPTSPRICGTDSSGSPFTCGHEYVWHCHILEHEEHDMMRPLVVR
jgi:spore coat protein A